MSTPRLLPGPSNLDDNTRREFEQGQTSGRLQRELEDMRRQVKALDDEVRARDRHIATLESSISNLQQALLPTYRGMQKLFGEFEKAGVDIPTTSQPGALEYNFWETQKRRFPGKATQIIELLLERPMSVMQIVTAGRMDRQTVYNHISKLTKAGLVTKDGGIFSLTRQ